MGKTRSTTSSGSGPRFAVGLDYGTNSARAVVVDIADGREIAAHVFAYPSGSHGIVLDPKDANLARQNPADHIHAFGEAVGGAVRGAGGVRGFSPERVVGLGVGATASTPLPVDANGRPLAFDRRFRRDPAALAWLWKDHTAHDEAAAITRLAREMKTPYLAKCGGAYSPEWFWAKIWRCRKTAPAVFKAAYSWVELADFIPAWACGATDFARVARGVCAAGHKAMYAEAWGGLPSKEFLARLHPDLARLRDRLYDQAVASDQCAGGLAPDVARRVGLPAGLPVAVGMVDGHVGAVGAGIKPGRLVKTIGTSGCDMLVAPAGQRVRDIAGICGIVPGSIVPGMVGLEAGQSAVGDLYQWFVGLSDPKAGADPARAARRHAELTAEAARLSPGESGLVALDWNNGNRNVLADPRLTGLLVGQTLHTTPGEVYRALIEATAFGALAIVRRFEEGGMKIREVVATGGIAEKNPFLLQCHADVLGRPIRVARSSRTCALGAAIFGAVAGGAHRDVASAQRSMTGVRPEAYRPRAAAARVYGELYGIYARLHDAFGGVGRPKAMDGVMKELLDIKARAQKKL